MGTTTINVEPPMHLGLNDLEPWKVGPNIPDVPLSTSTEALNDGVIVHSVSASRFLNYLENRQRNEKVSGRSNSLVEASKPSLLKKLLMRRCKSDSYLRLNYNDKINLRKEEGAEARDGEVVSPEEPVEQGLKLFSCLKKEVGESIQRSERPDITKVLPRLTTLLKYGGSKVKFETTIFVSDLLPHLGLDVDAFFVKLMPIVINNLAHSKDSISKVSMELLKTFAETTNYKNSFVDKFISFGLLNKNADIKDASVRFIPRLFSEEFTHLDLFHVFHALVKDLRVAEDSSSKKEDILNALKHIRYVEGPREFRRYESMLSPKSGHVLRGTALFDEEEEEAGEASQPQTDNEEEEEEDEDAATSSDDEDKLFEVVPREVLYKIGDVGAPHLRREGCEELLSFVEWKPSLEDLLPRMGTLLTLLNAFREDPDFTVATMSLRVISVLLMRMSSKEIGEYLFPFVLSTVLLFSDGRFVVRSEANKIYFALLQKFSARRICRNVVFTLNHRSSLVRETAVNLITSALLTFPRGSFDLVFLCREIVPALKDPKRRVRQAAMECVATLAQALGERKNKVLMTEVSHLEKSDRGKGVSRAVTSRLARRALPRLTSDGLVEHWLPAKGAARKTFSGVPLGADVEWILSGSGAMSLGSVCDPTPALLNSSCLSLESHLQESRQDLNLSASLPHHFLLSTMMRENVTSSLPRKRSISAETINIEEDERSSLALWSTEPIDLSRTTPHDLGGYRGVYLGKLRKNSALGRSLNAEKSYAILPNKFASGGVGSARATDKGGIASPQLSSPINCRKLNALEPIEQVDPSGNPLVHQTLPPMPPLRSGRTRPSEAVERIPASARKIGQLEDEDDEEDEGSYVQELLPEPEISEEEVVEEEDGEQEEMVRERNRERSSAETRDSGICIPSPEMDGGEDGGRVEEGTGENSSCSGRKKVELEPVASREEGRGVPTEDENEVGESTTASGEGMVMRKKVVTIVEPPMSSRGRTKFEPSMGAGRGPQGMASRDFAQSLPVATSMRPSPLMTKGRGYGAARARNKSRLPRAKKGEQNGIASDKMLFKSFDHESDFETDDEDPKGAPTSTITRVNLLKKKRDSMRELERRLTEKEAERAKEQRIRKYKELEERHSGNSLKITKPSHLDRLSADYVPQSNLKRTNPRLSPRGSPGMERKMLDLSLPKSRSYDRNLSQELVSPSGRPSSLDRLDTGLSKLPFSRAPPQQRRIIHSTGRSAPLAPKTPPSRRSTPGIGLESLEKEDRLSENDIPTACYQSPKILNTIRGEHFKPYKNSKDAHRETMELLRSNEWEDQVEGIQSLARLATFHPEVVLPDLKAIKLLLMKHTKCLRSQVCRTTLQAITQLFLSLKKQMEQDLEKMVVLLLHKTADTNKFLKDDSNCALDAIVEVTTPIKAVSALVQEGLGHRNPQVRTALARLLAYSTERLGAAQTINQKDVAEKIFTATIKLAQEGSLETRQMAKLTIQRLSTHPQFESTLKKYTNNEDLRQIHKVLTSIYNESRGDVSRTKAMKGRRFRRTM